MTDANSDPTQNTVEFAGGIFVAASVTASPPQNILYVFGSNSSDLPATAAIRSISMAPRTRVPTRVVFDGGTPFPINAAYAPITGIHVRGEDGNEVLHVDADVTLPLWLYGGATTEILDGGSGQNVVNSDIGSNTPQIVDDAAGDASGSSYTYHGDCSLGRPGRTARPAGASTAPNMSTRRSPAAPPRQRGRLPISTRAGIMTYMSPGRRSRVPRPPRNTRFDGTDRPSLAGRCATVNQTLAPADDQEAGVFWHDLGVFQAASGTLVVQLDTDSTGEVLADAAMIVPLETAPVTNLTMDSFTVDSQWQLFRDLHDQRRRFAALQHRHLRLARRPPGRLAPLAFRGRGRG